MENENRIPVHVSIIMDGNGRWAREQGHERIFGHKKGVETVRVVAEAAAEAGVKYLSLYAFSEENWGRPKEEVDFLHASDDGFHCIGGGDAHEERSAFPCSRKS